MISTALRPSSGHTVKHESCRRRVSLLLAAFLVLLLGATPPPALGHEPPVVAAATYPVPIPTHLYELERVWFGYTELHRLVLMYRWRHPEVSSLRNVAVFLFEEHDETWAAVFPSIGRFRNNDKVAPIEIFRRDSRAPDGWQRLTRSGELVNWRGVEEEVRAGKEPTALWSVAQRPEIDRLHSEQIAYLYLTEQEKARHVYRGLSEQIPCDAVQIECRVRLQTPGIPAGDYNMFPLLGLMEYLTDPDDPATGDRVEQLEEWVSAGRPIGPLADHRLFNLPGDVPAQGAAVTALKGAARDDLGGVDFTTLELRYLADPGDGEGLQYAFHADLSSSEDPDLDAGRTAALHASDAFFVWLSLPRSTFWVNLHPYEPDRIVHPALGTTDVGRILLEADLEMKRTEAKLIHPDTELGQEYWAAVEAAGPEPCMSARMWIVPGPATVYEEDGGLYILDAPLEVKMEAESIGAPTEREPTDDPCHRPAGAPEPPHEKFSQERVLPLIEEAVNKAPEYAELRQVYLSRVAAEWYREHSRHTDTSLAWLIDSGDVSAWPAMRDWSSQEVFDDYVESFNEGEFNVRREVQQGSDLYEVIYIFGGVDFGTVPITSLEDSQFQVNWVGLPDAVGRAIDQPAMTPDNGVWLGGTAHPTAPDGWEAAARGPTNNIGQLVTIVVVAVLILMVAGVGITMAIVLSRGRLSHRPTGMPHSPPRPPPYRHW